MRDNPHYSDTDRAGFIEDHRMALKSLRGRVCAEITTNLDILRTFSYAEDTVISVLCDFMPADSGACRTVKGGLSTYDQ